MKNNNPGKNHSNRIKNIWFKQLIFIWFKPASPDAKMYVGKKVKQLNNFENIKSVFHTSIFHFAQRV